MKTKRFVVAVAAMLLLTACGSSTTSSSEENFSKNTDSITETMYNLQIVGDMKGEASWPTWDPTKAVTAQKFTRVSKMKWTLTGVTLNADDQFKFTFDDKWSNDFGWKGTDTTATTFPTDYLEAADTAAVAKGDDSNIKVKKAGTFNFEYHPFYVAEDGIGNKMVVTLAA